MLLDLSMNIMEAYRFVEFAIEAQLLLAFEGKIPAKLSHQRRTLERCRLLIHVHEMKYPNVSEKT